MQRLSLVIAALALVIGLWNAWSLQLLTWQLEAGRPGRSAKGPERPEGEPSEDGAGEPGWSERRRPPEQGGEPGARPAPEGGNNPAFPEKLADPLPPAEQAKQDEARGRQMEAQMQDDLEEFAVDEDLDEETTEALIAAFKKRGTAFRDLRRKIRDGGLTAAEGQARLDALRDQGDAETEALIGADRAEKLLLKMAASRPPGAPPPGAPPR